MKSAQFGILLGMLCWQLGMPAVLAVVVGLTLGWHQALSLLAGGVVVFLGTFVGVKVAYRDGASSASATLLRLLEAEVIKIVVIALLLLLLFKTYRQLVPWGMMLGLAISALASARLLATLKSST